MARCCGVSPRSSLAAHSGRVGRLPVPHRSLSRDKTRALRNHSSREPTFLRAASTPPPSLPPQPPGPPAPGSLGAPRWSRSTTPCSGRVVSACRSSQVAGVGVGLRVKIVQGVVPKLRVFLGSIGQDVLVNSALKL